jgi:hypothetical protein
VETISTPLLPSICQIGFSIVPDILLIICSG